MKLDDCFGRDGQPITLDEYLRLHQDADYRVVRRTELVGEGGRKLHVITSWMGRDQGPALDDSGPPLIFGTIGHDADTDEWLDRVEHFHATEAEALQYHEELVERLTDR